MTLPGYFIAPDAAGDVYIWRDVAGVPAAPVISRRDLRDDPVLWNAIAILVEATP